MTAIVQALQAASPLLPPKAIQFFCDDYFEDKVEVYTDFVTFVVEHNTSVDSEPIEADGWSNSSESHYTSVVGCNYIASTKITSVKLLIVEGVETACIKSQLSTEVLNQIQFFIESLAEQHAKDADCEY